MFRALKPLLNQFLSLYISLSLHSDNRTRLLVLHVCVSLDFYPFYLIAEIFRLRTKPFAWLSMIEVVVATHTTHCWAEYIVIHRAFPYLDCLWPYLTFIIFLFPLSMWLCFSPTYTHTDLQLSFTVYCDFRLWFSPSVWLRDDILHPELLDIHVSIRVSLPVLLCQLGS